MITIGAICSGVVALVIVLIVALGGSDEKLSAQGGDTSSPAPTTTAAVKATTTTAADDEPATTEAEAAETTTTAAPTTVAETTTTVVDTTTTVVETTTTVAATAPPSTAAAVTPVTAAAVGNCTPIGALSIPKTNTLQTIIKETKQYSDGLLCGNHKSDGIAEGVDVLPGMASFEASLDGGGALAGQIPAIIFGHRNSHNRPFRKIDTLVPGDAVAIIYLDGTTIDLVVSNLQLMSVGAATDFLLAPSADGEPGIHLVACAHADGTPGGVSHRWIATVVRA